MAAKLGLELDRSRKKSFIKKISVYLVYANGPQKRCDYSAISQKMVHKGTPSTVDYFVTFLRMEKLNALNNVASFLAHIFFLSRKKGQKIFSSEKETFFS